MFICARAESAKINSSLVEPRFILSSASSQLVSERAPTEQATRARVYMRFMLCEGEKLEANVQTQRQRPQRGVGVEAAREGFVVVGVVKVDGVDGHKVHFHAAHAQAFGH